MTIALAAPTPSIHRLTAEEFEAMPDSKGFELVDGLLLENTVGTESSWISLEIAARIRDYVRPRQLGWAFGPETAFRCFSDDANRIRKPDAAFVRKGRFADERLPSGLCTFPPDLAVEVVSPRDTAGDLERKLQEYLAAGVRLVWVVYPEARTARVLRAAGQPSQLNFEDALDGEDVLPGFRLRLAEVFPPAPVPSAGPSPSAPSAPAEPPAIS